MRAARGFTLLEILVVLVIVSIMVSVVTLAVGTNPVRDLDREARRFMALIDLASQDAILGGRELAVDFSNEGYRFSVFDIETEAWQQLDDDEHLYPRELPENMALIAYVDDEETPDPNAGENPLVGEEGIGANRVYLLSSGEMTPFEANIKLDDGPSYTVTGDMLGSLELKLPGEE